MRQHLLARFANCLALPLALSVGALGLPTTVLAAPTQVDKEEAQARFEHGVELFKDGDFESALFEFRGAYELADNPQLLYNIAVCETELRNYAGAVAAYEQYLSALGSELSSEREAKVNGELAKLKKRVGELSVTSTPPGATVRIGGEIVGETPLTLDRNIGSIQVEVSLDGYETKTEVASVVAKGKTNVSVGLAKAGGNSTPGKPPERQPRKTDSDDEEDDPARAQDKLRVAALVTLGGSGAFAAGGIVTGVLAIQADNELNDADSVDSQSALDDVRSRRRTLTTTTGVLLGTSVVLGLTSIALAATFIGRKKRSQSARVRPGLGTLAIRF